MEHFDHMQLMPDKGDFLLSEPFLQDPYFNRAVISMCSIDKTEGAFGFIINKPLDVNLGDVLENAGKLNAPLHFGGPVSPEILHIIHPFGGVSVPGSKRILDGLYWTTNFEAIKEILEKKPAKEEECKFLLGYSGWDFDQLQEEVKERTWVTVNGNKEDCFSEENNETWAKLMRNLGGEYSILANAPVSPILN